MTVGVDDEAEVTVGVDDEAEVDKSIGIATELGYKMFCWVDGFSDRSISIRKGNGSRVG